MEQSSDKLKSNSPESESKSGSDTVTDSDLSRSINTRVRAHNHNRNSDLPINKVLDLLYNIFSLTIFNSYFPEIAILKISHVCRYWRKCALEWPALWGFLDFSSHPSFLRLCMERSGSAPLALVWNMRHRRYNTSSFDSSFSEIFFFNNSSNISPRLTSLTFHATWDDLTKLHNCLKRPQSPPLQLQRLDIVLHPEFTNSVRTQDMPMVTNLTDTSHLRELIISGLDLPWPDLPHGNLTQFSFRRPLTVPTLSRLFAFLSTCPLLKKLDLDFSDEDGWETKDINATSSVIINKLALPFLSELSLFAWRELSGCYMQQFLRHLQPLESLSRYRIKMSHIRPHKNTNQIGSLSFPPASVFETIPSRILSQLSNHRYLRITLSNFKCTICADDIPKPKPDFHRLRSALDAQVSRWPALYISAKEYDSDAARLSINYSPIVNLACAMPGIEYLKLKSDAWMIFTQLKDIRTAFPYLHTLELVDSSRGVSEILESIILSSPDSNSVPNLRTLKLLRTSTSYNMLLRLIAKFKIKVLEVCFSPAHRLDGTTKGWTEFTSDLRNIGVVVQLRDLCPVWHAEQVSGERAEFSISLDSQYMSE